MAGAWRLVPRVSGVFHDDAIYVITGKALAEGQEYRLINLPEAPPQTKYPILYPAILAVIWKSWPKFPDNLLAMQLVSLLAAAAAAGLSHLYLVRFGYCSRLTSGVSVLLCATTPTVLYISTLTLSEMPFALLSILALWTADADLRSPARTRLGQVATGIMLGVPYLCRTAGLPLIIAAIALLAWRRKPVLWTVVGSFLVVTPWMAWAVVPSVLWRDNPIVGYYTDYSAGFSPFTGEGLRVATVNLLLLSRDSAGLVLSGLDAATGALGFRIAKLLVLLGAGAWTYIVWQVKRGQLLPWWLVLYASVVCVWPWPPWRLLVPILPLLVAHLAGALRAVARRVVLQGRHRYVLAACASLALLANLISVVAAGRASDRSGYPHQFVPEVTSEFPTAASWSAYEDMFRWVRSHVGADEIIASGLDTMVSLYTDRKAFRPWVHRPEALFYGAKLPKTGTPKEFLEILRMHRARYLVMVPMEGFSEAVPFAELVREVRETHPGTLVLVYQGADPRFMAFEIR